ncbi:MAG: hypothetical protein DWQ37_11665 [Planctomycetota bacterium]|nr:MAG: hypothetical protein DWQ37_11665 [Planctomycetota bacterium]
MRIFRRNRGPWERKPGRHVLGVHRLGLEPLEARRLLHAHDPNDPDLDVNELVDLSPPAPPLEPQALHPLSSIPALDSLPGAAVSVYLDFDGFYEAVWGSYSNITTPVYDRDNDPTTFSDAELDDIEDIWAQVSEDFAPFQLNVTTVEPPSFANGVALRVAIGGDGAWTGGTYGGIAYVNNFTSSTSNTVYVFPDHLGSDKSVAEASSHEAGHGFGLRHQSQYNAGGTKIAEYYAGPGDGRAPIMGNSYGATRGLWWYGTSSQGSTTFQDDMALISRAANGFGYRPDDHGNTPATASLMTPAGSELVATGVITTTDDVDYFSFETEGGEVTLSVTLPAHNNLDAVLELRDEFGSLIDRAAPSGSFGATLTAVLQPGSYRAVVASEGGYGDVGQYTLNADVLPPSIEGTVFLDDNRNGVLDEGESGIAGAALFDDVNGNGVWDAVAYVTPVSLDTPLPIPQLGSVMSTFMTSALPGKIADVNVHVNILHERDSSLFIGLTAPDGTIVSLAALGGGDGDNYIDTVFDDQAPTSINAGVAPFTGSYRPLGSLANLIGSTPNGQWKLIVSDVTSGDPAGTLLDWSVEITLDVPEPTATTDAVGRYLFAFAGSGNHTIRQVAEPGLVQTSPAGGAYDVAVTVGTPIENLDFGNAPPAVVNRALFYNASSFDGASAAIGPADDAAIATDKVPYLAGSGPATFDNISSYVRGINGLMIDIAGDLGPISADDFEFRLSDGNEPAVWTAAPAPSAISVRPGAGVSGSDRIAITWDNGAIQNTWLEVTVLAGADTSLDAPDVFYFGNLVGDTGSGTAAFAVTNASDEIDARNNVGIGAGITNLYDFDRSGLVTALDAIAARNHSGLLAKLDLPLPSPPEADTGEPNAVAMALAIESSPSLLDAGDLYVEPADATSGGDAVALPRSIAAEAESAVGPLAGIAIAEALPEIDEELLDRLTEALVG